MRAALIGLGMVAPTYGEAIRNSDKVTLGKVFARTPGSRSAFLDKFPDLGAEAAESVEEIAADPDIDFAILATPREEAAVPTEWTKASIPPFV